MIYVFIDQPMDPTKKQTTEEGNVVTTFITDNALPFALKIIWAIAAVTVILIIAKIIARSVKRSIILHSPNTDKNTDKIWGLMGDIAYYVMVLFAFFIGFEIIWFDVSLILWWVSFWIWLALKEILGNMVAGIMILYTKEFKLWDIVEIQADQVYFGRIEEITVRYTIIRTLDLRQVVLPNKTLISSPIKTFSAEEMIRLDTTAFIHYDSDVWKSIEIVKNTINWFKFVKTKESTTVFLWSLSSSSIDLKCYFYFDPNCWILPEVAIWYINEMVTNQLNANWISIPYDHLTLTFDKREDKKEIAKLFVEPKEQQNSTPTPPLA